MPTYDVWPDYAPGPVPVEADNIRQVVRKERRNLDAIPADREPTHYDGDKFAYFRTRDGHGVYIMSR